MEVLERYTIKRDLPPNSLFNYMTLPSVVPNLCATVIDFEVDVGDKRPIRNSFKTIGCDMPQKNGPGSLSG